MFALHEVDLWKKKYNLTDMNDDDRDELIHALARGERVSRHTYDVPKYDIKVWEEMDILTRDGGGYLVAGDQLELFFELFDA